MLKSLLGLAAVAAVSVSLLGGCAQLPSDYHRQVLSISYPEIAEIQTVTRGDRIVSQGVYLKGEYLRIDQPAGNSDYQIPSGHFLKRGEDGNEVVFYSINANNQSVTHDLFADPAIALSIDKTVSQDDPEREVCVKSDALGLTAINHCQVVPYKYGVLTFISPDNLHKAIIFAKIENDVATFYYQERLHDEIVRNEPFDVNLSEQKRFSYAGATFDVLCYTANSITYKLVSHFKFDEHMVIGAFEQL